ncbi:hypothetical protein HPB49_008071 [Dermacentor silvarum]|uniref:Uncharacterized protein n=1 Tax=Dermacentor silvarum TaxID=543639 RepID=A0ACB8CE13_DERSI|nr:hypothetical protein HPB49_008071 [Dermacentor silvarum]
MAHIAGCQPAASTSTGGSGGGAVTTAPPAPGVEAAAGPSSQETNAMDFQDISVDHHDDFAIMDEDLSQGTPSECPYYNLSLHLKNLRLEIQNITEEATSYVTKLIQQNWIQFCTSLKGTLSTAQAWAILRCLIEPDQAKSTTSRTLQEITHKFPGNDQDLIDTLKSRYLGSDTMQPCILKYEGEPRPELDAPIPEEEAVAASLQETGMAVEGFAAASGRLCAPEKVKVIRVNIGGIYNSPGPINLYLEYQKVTESKKTRILSFWIQCDLKGLADYQTNEKKPRGMREKDPHCLVQALVISRVTHSMRYHYHSLNKCDQEQVDAIINRA